MYARDVYSCRRSKRTVRNVHEESDLSIVAKEDIVSTILNHEEFIAHAEKVDEAYSVWKEKVIPILSSLTVEDNPKSIVKIIAESLLEQFKEVALIDEYDIYQVLMEYWEEIMQDGK